MTDYIKLSAREVQAARHVLWFAENLTGDDVTQIHGLTLQPGSFTKSLIDAMFKADAANRSRVGENFPELFLAVSIYKEAPDGRARLIDMVSKMPDGGITEADTGNMFASQEARAEFWKAYAQDMELALTWLSRTDDKWTAEAEDLDDDGLALTWRVEYDDDKTSFLVGKGSPAHKIAQFLAMLPERERVTG